MSRRFGRTPSTSLPLAALVLAGLILTAPGGRPAAAADKDPIDVALEQCLDRPDGMTTAGQVACATAAYEAWDKELNAVYRRLMAALDPSSQVLLRDAQRHWVAYRDAEFAFLGGPWSEDKGSIMQIIRNATAVDFVRSRVVELRGSLALIEAPAR